jgi:hypothetical protein
MELGDADFPPLAQAWALVGAIEMDEWVQRTEAGSEDPVSDLASVMLTVIEGQSRIISQLSARIDGRSA